MFQHEMSVLTTYATSLQPTLQLLPSTSCEKANSNRIEQEQEYTLFTSALSFLTTQIKSINDVAKGLEFICQIWQNIAKLNRIIILSLN